MKDYSKMSDFEINKAVAINRCGYQGRVEHTEHGVKESDRDSNGMFYFERDYCNNPSDAWPIIFENEISLVVVEDGVWVARFGGVFDESSNPLRSAMIVYLMIEDDGQ